MKHSHATRFISFLLALLMTLAIPAAALEQSALGTEDTPGTQETEETGDSASGPVEIEYFDEDGSYNAPKSLVIYRTGLLDGSSVADPLPEDSYTGVVAFYDYENDEELEEPYFFYYENGRLQDNEPRTARTASYLQTYAVNPDTEDVSYSAAEVYVDPEAGEHPEYTFAFNREDGEANGILPEESEPAEDAAEPAPAMSGLTMSLEEDGRLVLSWDAAESAVRYHVSRDGEELAETAETSVTDQTAGESGKTYTYEVRAQYADGSLSPEGACELEYTCYPIPAVTAETAAGGVQVSWTGDADANGYRILRSEAGGDWEIVTDLTGLEEETSYLDVSAGSDATYAYAVQSYYGETSAISRAAETEDVWSSYTASDAVYYLESPVIERIYSTGEGIAAVWAAVNGAENYRVLRKSAPQGNWETLGTTGETSYTDTSAKSGTTYYYTVQALSAEGESTYYDTSLDAANGVVLRGAPTVTVASKPGGAQVSWTKDADAKGYRVFRRDGDDWTAIANVAAGKTYYLDADAQSGTELSYAVRTYYGSGAIADAAEEDSSDWSPLSAAATFQYLAAPVLGRVYSSEGGMTVYWEAVDGAESYTIFRRSNPSEKWATKAVVRNGSATSYLDKTAVYGSSYYYTVVACAGENDSIRSGYYIPAEATTYHAAPVTTVKVNTTGIQVNWTTDPAATGYRIYRTGNKQTVAVATLLGANVSSYQDKSAVSGTTYVYCVRAYYGEKLSGSLAYSATNGLWSGKTNSEAVYYLATPEVGDCYSALTGVTVTWTPVKGADGYEVFRRVGTEKNTRIAKVAGQNASSYIDQTVQNNGAYYYFVRAYRGSGSSIVYSDFIRETPKVIFHKAPTITCKGSDTSVTVTWTRDTSAKGYRLYRRVKGTGTWLVLLNATSNTTVSYVDKNVSCGVTYEYAVRSYFGSTAIGSTGVANDNNWSGSAVARITYYTTPVLRTGENTETGVKITWKKVTGAAGYIVFRKQGATDKWRQIAEISNGSTEAYVDTKAPQLGSGTTLYYTVLAFNADKTSQSRWDETGIRVVYLDAPEMGTVKVSSSGTSVTWGAVKGAQKYYIYRRKSNTSWERIGEATSTSYVDTAVKSNATPYFYTVRALRVDTVNGKQVTSLSYYDREGKTFGIQMSGSGWVNKDGNTYYVKDGVALTGWQYLSRNGGTYKYYFDTKTGALATNLYSYFGKSYRSLETRITINLTNQSSNPGQVAIYVYNSETKKYDIPTATFRGIGSMKKTFGSGSSVGYMSPRSGQRWLDLGSFEQYAVYIRNTPSWFHSCIYYGAPSNRKFSPSTYNSMVANNNNSNGCIRLQCIYSYLILDIMKNGYGKSNRVTVECFKHGTSKGPFGVPKVDRISTSLNYDPTDPSITGKFFYATSAVGVSASAGAKTWCTYA